MARSMREQPFFRFHFLLFVVVMVVSTCVMLVSSPAKNLKIVSDLEWTLSDVVVI